jgi:CRP-like cAMP-binding protein
MKKDIFSYNWLKNINLPTQKLIIDYLKTVKLLDSEFVHYAGDKADGLYFIEKGTVRINKLSEEGKELLIKDLVAGEWFGFIGCFGSGFRPNDAIAIGTTTIQHLTQSKLEKVIEFDPSIGLNIANFLANYVEFYARVYEQSVFMSLANRLETTLQQLCRWKVSSSINVSQSELAAMLGVTKEAIGVHLNALQNKQIIKLGYRKIEYLADYN